MNASENTISFEGIISHIINYGFNGGLIFIIEPYESIYEELKVKITSTIEVVLPVVGEIWFVRGIYDEDDTYGEQLLAKEAYPILPSGRKVVDFLKKNNKFTGIRKETAKALWQYFGNELYDVLTRRDIKIICNNVKIRELVAKNLIEEWGKYAELIPVFKFLNLLNFDARIAKKVIKFWGKETISEITEDPYRLLAFASWDIVDQCALEKLNCNYDSDNRMIAAVEATIYADYDKNNTAISHHKLINNVEKLLGSLIDANLAVEKALQDGRVILYKSEPELIYQSLGAYALESYISDRIKKIESGESKQISFFQKKYFEDRLNEFERTLGYPLAKEQRDAIMMVSKSSFGIIVGGSGTGKTMVLKGIYHMLPKNSVVIQIALTNHAVVRMSDATGRDAMTIYKLLKLAEFKGLPDNLWLFIDDASVLNVPLFYQILRALPEGSRLYLIGDPYQLAPIGPGLILHLMVRHKYPNLIELIKVHRQAYDTGIPQVAADICEMKCPSIEKFETLKHDGVGITFKEVKNKIHLLDDILAVYRELASEGETQIVAAQIDTCKAVNITLHNESVELQIYNKQPVSYITGKNVNLSEGDKIVYTDHVNIQRGLFNGSQGLLLKIYDNPVIEIDNNGNDILYLAEAEFNTSGKIQLTQDDISHIDLGYAITVHNAQGSQWNKVIIVSEFVSKNNPTVDNAWFYTAITRCENQAVIIGSLENFNYQVSRTPRSFSRNVGLSFRI